MDTRGDFVRTLATEVWDATIASIEDVVAFVTWLDEDLSFLVGTNSVYYTIGQIYVGTCVTLIESSSG